MLGLWCGFVMFVGCREPSPVKAAQANMAALCDDQDQDGFCDEEDICLDGDDSSDVDQDGVPDACDPCPLDPKDDRDGDTLCDGVDPCPTGHELLDAGLLPDPDRLAAVDDALLGVARDVVGGPARDEQRAQGDAVGLTTQYRVRLSLIHI